MPLSQIQLLAVDLDGTLVPRGDEVSDRTRDTVVRAGEHGLRVVIATGRRYRTTMRIVERLGVPLPVVVLGGALVKDATGRTLHHAAMASDSLSQLISMLRARGQTAVCQRACDLHEGADFFLDAVPDWNPHTRRYHDRNADYAVVTSDLATTRRDDVVVVGCFAEEDAIRSAEEAVRAEFGDVFEVLAMSSPGDMGGWYTEIRPRHVSKWSGLTHLASHLGVSTDAICTVGDEVNDIPMFEGARVAVAMGNADKDVQRSAHRVTGTSEDDGVAQLIDEILAARGDSNP